KVADAPDGWIEIDAAALGGAPATHCRSIVKMGWSCRQVASRRGLAVVLAHPRSTYDQLCSAPRLEQPRREIAPVPQLRDLQPDRADTRVPSSLSVAVALVASLVRAIAVAGAADSVDHRTHQQFHHLDEHGPQRIRCGLFDLLAQPLDRLDAGRCGHPFLL